MNFICEKCKQKYHVADEKLQGRAVTRFRCKKCDHIIELEAPTQTALGGAVAPSTNAPVRPATLAVPVARTAGAAKTRPATTSGPAFGTAGFNGGSARAATLATPAARATASAQLSNRPGAPDRGWYAGIRDVPVGPLTRGELGARVQSGDVTVDTLVWREGLEDWRPLQQVTELADLLRPATATATATAAEVAARSSATRSARPSILDDEEDEATRVSGLDPSLAGIMAKGARAAADKSEPEKPRATTSSLSPLARPAAVARPSATASTRPEVEPAAAAPSTEARATPATTPPPTETEAAPAATASTPPSPPAARASDEPDEPDETLVSTRVAADAGPEKLPPREASVSEKRPEEELLDELFARPAKTGGTATQRSPLESSPLLTPPSNPPSNPPATPTPAPPATHSAPPAAPAPAPPATHSAPPAAPAPAPPATRSAPPAAPAPAPATTIANTATTVAAPATTVSAPAATPVAPAPAPRGLTPAIWLMMVGVLIAGLLGGLFLGRMNQPTPAPPAPPPSGAPRSEAPTAKPAPRTASAVLRGRDRGGLEARPADAPGVTL